jgi:hypothetical protein
MDQSIRFAEVLDAVGALSPEEQVTLVDIVAHRLAEEDRKRVLADVEESRHEYAQGRCQPVTIEQLRDEISS